MNPGPGNKRYRRATWRGLWLAGLALFVSMAVRAQAPLPPGQAPGMPGLAPGLPGVTPYVPGATPGMPGLAPGVPGAAPGIPGMAPGVPGLAPGFPAIAPGMNPFPFGNPYMQLQVPVQNQVQNPAQNNQASSPSAGTVPGVYNPPQPGLQPYMRRNPWAFPPAQPAPVYPAQQPAQLTAIAPYVETELESASAYVHQNLVLKVNVISTVNLKTATAQMQDTDDVILRQLGDATVDTRTRGGQTEIVNTLYFQLTPLRSGRIDLEPVRITGTMDLGSGSEASYEAKSSRTMRLEVADPDSSVQPWLPLQELVISASLSNDERIGEGEPITLTVVQRAIGMSGAQLPSLEPQLQSSGHRLYREKSDYEGTISREGKLVGTRTDRYTLVPQQGNEVNIPALRVDWWNVDRQRKETAVLPSRLLNERERGSGEEGVSIIGQPAAETVVWLIWAASMVAAFLLGRFWPRLAPPLRRFRFWLWQQLHTASQPALRRTAEVLSRMSPQRNLHRLRRAVADSLPRSARLWFCVRSADDEKDPDDWSQVLRFLINRRLGLSAQLPMSKLAQKIIEIHPGADEDRIRALLGELEAALFAGRPIQDFEGWKKEFKRQIRPHPFARWRRREWFVRGTGLPALNPTAN